MVFTGTSGNLSVALYLASLAEVGQGRTLTRVEIAAIAWGVNILSGIINTVGTKAIGHMSAFNLWWTLGGTFVLVITLLVKAPVKVRDLRLQGCLSSSRSHLGIEQRFFCLHRLREVRFQNIERLRGLPFLTPLQLHGLVQSGICCAPRLPPGLATYPPSSRPHHLTPL